ncbi:D-alanyl-D-alanine carboxypeptidase [Micromonospora echinospora]|uniref:D-alanyl-D-alanine carboxypeptidase (Penicillin-binding protein 5/6) n=1 Tax=Micromonospora echinospora TaxID=1877 RepID=A0A1C4ZDX3_MICEC|nr:serine hydrolase [Micromonospora echinospora]OZV80413.1 D-alanyl-D-alanine carboxypeptidase [Micromonospora echinospora]SCF31168.1 D-alanyl-D-alanine carboxypeptidase (penicillin-binding protein 5/6) [Micromonospora echinospora]
MTGSATRGAAAVVGALVLGVATAVPVPAAGAASTPTAALPSATGRPVGAGAPPPAVPCPRQPAPAVSRPPRPVPPPVAPAERAVGGTALATSGLVVPAGSSPPPRVTATSWLVADLDTGAVLGGCGPHEPGTPASVQKLLLAATLLPSLDPRRVVTVTRADLDIEPGSSAVGLVEGGRYPVELLWLGLLLQSGNDTANVLARLGGGAQGAAGGVRAMNERAHRLGAYQTRAVTPSGLDGPGQFTSAYDLALIARVCFADPTFRRYALTRQAQVPAQGRLARGFQIQNENPLVDRYPGALGGKTGFTDLARHTYVGAAERDGRRLVVTLLGAEPRPLRGWQQGAALLDWGFSLPRNATVGRLVDPGEPVPGATPAGVPATAPAVAAAPAAGTSGGFRWPGVAGVGLALLGAILAVVTLRRRRGDRTSADG